MLQNNGSFPVMIQPVSQTVMTGANVVFAISPTNSSSPLNYQWRRNQTNISGATNLTLQLLDVTTNDAANYDAVLSDTNGSIGSAVATLTVQCNPIITWPNPIPHPLRNGSRFQPVGCFGERGRQLCLQSDKRHCSQRRHPDAFCHFHSVRRGGLQHGN